MLAHQRVGSRASGVVPRGAKVIDGAGPYPRPGMIVTSDIDLPPPDEPELGRLAVALDKAIEAVAIEMKIRDALRAPHRRCPGQSPGRERAQGRSGHARRARPAQARRRGARRAIQVDAFDAKASRALVR
jgi:hypothetical protein